MARVFERKHSALCPACQDPDCILITPILRSDKKGLFAVGGRVRCRSCGKLYTIVLGAVVKDPARVSEPSPPPVNQKDKDVLRDLAAKYNPDGDLNW